MFDISGFVQRMHENLFSIKESVSGLSTDSHNAQIEELEQQRDSLLQGLRTIFDKELEEAEAQRQTGRDELKEKRRIEDEEREARRKEEDDALQSKADAEDLARQEKLDGDIKLIDEDTDKKMDVIEESARALIEEAKSKITALEEQKKEINQLIDEHLQIALPEMPTRKRGRTDKAVEDGPVAQDEPVAESSEPATEPAAGSVEEPAAEEPAAEEPAVEAPEAAAEPSEEPAAAPVEEPATTDAEPAAEEPASEVAETATEAPAEPAAEPAAETVPEPTTEEPEAAEVSESVAEAPVEIAAESAAESTTESAVEPAAEPATEPAAEPAADAPVEPAKEPAAESAVESTPESAVEPAAEPVPEPATENVPEATTEEPAAEVPESAADAPVEPTAEAVAEAATEPAADSTTEVPAETAPEPTEEPVAEVSEPVAEPAAETPATEPVKELTTETAAEPVATEPVTEAAVENPAEPTDEPTTETAAADPVEEPAVEAAIETPAEIAVEPATEKIAEAPTDAPVEAATAEPVEEPTVEAPTEVATEAAAESVTDVPAEPAAEPSAETVTEPETAPVEEIIPEPASTESVEEAAAQPAAESTAESAAEPTAEPVDEEPATEQPVTEELVVEEPVVDSATEKTVVEDPATVEPTTEPATEAVAETITEAESAPESAPESAIEPASDPVAPNIVEEHTPEATSEIDTEPETEIAVAEESAAKELVVEESASAQDEPNAKDVETVEESSAQAVEAADATKTLETPIEATEATEATEAEQPVDRTTAATPVIEISPAESTDATAPVEETVAETVEPTKAVDVSAEPVNEEVLKQDPKDVPTHPEVIEGEANISPDDKNEIMAPIAEPIPAQEAVTDKPTEQIAHDTETARDVVEPVQDSAEKSTEIPADQPTAEPVEASVEKPVEVTPDEATQETVKEPVETPAQEEIRDVAAQAPAQVVHDSVPTKDNTVETVHDETVIPDQQMHSATPAESAEVDSAESTEPSQPSTADTTLDADDLAHVDIDDSDLPEEKRESATADSGMKSDEAARDTQEEESPAVNVIHFPSEPASLPPSEAQSQSVRESSDVPNSKSAFESGNEADQPVSGRPEDEQVGTIPQSPVQTGIPSFTNIKADQPRRSDFYREPFQGSSPDEEREPAQAVGNGVEHQEEADPSPAERIEPLDSASDNLKVTPVDAPARGVAPSPLPVENVTVQGSEDLFDDDAASSHFSDEDDSEIINSFPVAHSANVSTYNMRESSPAQYDGASWGELTDQSTDEPHAVSSMPQEEQTPTQGKFDFSKSFGIRVVDGNGIRVVDSDGQEEDAKSVHRAQTPSLAPTAHGNNREVSPFVLQSTNSPGTPKRGGLSASRHAAPTPTKYSEPEVEQEDEDDSSMYAPRDVTNVFWHARSPSTLSTRPSSPAPSSLSVDKREPTIEESRRGSISGRSYMSGDDEFDPFKYDSAKPSPSDFASSRRSVHIHPPVTEPSRSISGSQAGGSHTFQKLRNVFEPPGGDSGEGSTAVSTIPSRSASITVPTIGRKRSSSQVHESRLPVDSEKKAARKTISGGRNDDKSERSSLLRSFSRGSRH